MTTPFSDSSGPNPFESPDKNPPPTSLTMADKLTVTAHSLNVRDEPSLQGKVLGALKKGTTVTLLSTSGDGYWRKIESGNLRGWSSQKYLEAFSTVSSGSDFPWFEIAQREIGEKEVLGSGANPRIVEYLNSTTLSAPDRTSDETPWCSAFVNWSVEKAGYAGTDSAWARSWLNWGKKVSTPPLGAIVVFRRGNGGHVGFYVSKTATTIKVLGGNQSNSVCIQNYKTTNLLGFRVPA